MESKRIKALLARREQRRRERIFRIFSNLICVVALTGCSVGLVALEKEDQEIQKAQEQTVIVAEVPEKAVIVPARDLTVERFIDVVKEAPEDETYFDVPLSYELQDHIFDECEDAGIDPAILVAMAYKESTFNPDSIGDNGDSFGLYQIQPRWHSGRMERLGVTDLFDPFQNATVAVDYLGELLNRGKGLEWALAAYNAGPSGANKGYGCNYANAVTEFAGEINGK